MTLFLHVFTKTVNRVPTIIRLARFLRIAAVNEHVNLVNADRQLNLFVVETAFALADQVLVEQLPELREAPEISETDECLDCSAKKGFINKD